MQQARGKGVCGGSEGFCVPSPGAVGARQFQVVHHARKRVTGCPACLIFCFYMNLNMCVCVHKTHAPAPLYLCAFQHVDLSLQVRICLWLYIHASICDNCIH